jgi:hypothetical protein
MGTEVKSVKDTTVSRMLKQIFLPILAIYLLILLSIGIVLSLPSPLFVRDAYFLEDNIPKFINQIAPLPDETGLITERVCININLLAIAELGDTLKSIEQQFDESFALIVNAYRIPRDSTHFSLIDGFNPDTILNARIIAMGLSSSAIACWKPEFIIGTNLVSIYFQSPSKDHYFYTWAFIVQDSVSMADYTENELVLDFVSQSND